MIISRIIRYVKIKKLIRQGLKIGKNCVISSFSFGTEPYLITIGDNCRITAGVKFITHDGSLWVLRNLKRELKDIDMFGKIQIGNNVNIGNHSIIMPGVTIGDNVIIGAGSIVTRSVPNNSVVAGVPAKILGSINDFELKYRNLFLPTKQMNFTEKKNYVLNHDKFIIK